MSGPGTSPGERPFFSTELKLFGGLVIAWLLGFGVFLLDRFRIAAFLPPGVLTMLFELLLEGSIIASFFLAPKAAADNRWFLWFFCMLLPADVCYLLLHYVLRQNEENWLTFLLTTLPYSAAYVTASIGFFRHIWPRLRNTRWLSFIWLPILLVVPAVFGILMPLLQAHQRAGGWGFDLTEIAFNSAFAVVFFFWSTVTLMMSLDRFFPFIGLAGIISQLGNWGGISAYLLHQNTFTFGEYEFLWLCGIITFWYGFVVVARLPAATAPAAGPEPPSPTDGWERRGSLVIQQRMTIIGLISGSLICAVLLSSRDIWSYRIVFFGIAAGSFIALLIGELLSKQIVHYATLFGRVVNLTAKDDAPQSREYEIPLELWQVYRLAFHQDMVEHRTAAAVRQNLAELASQVAHDIRSPLAALDSVIKDVSQLPEEKRILVRSAVSRIHDIANDLIDRNRGLRAAVAPAQSAAEPFTRELLSSHVAPLITEKRLQLRSRIGISIDARLDSAAYGLFADIQPMEFKRVLSNLIDNAVEALGGKGGVQVILACEEDQVLLKVQDNGKGIPPEVLKRLGGRGETYGKPGGSGLGLHHAKTSVESWGGSLGLESEVGRGTTVTVMLPKARPPEWFVSVLELDPDGTVVVLDDDTSIHQVWQGRFESLQTKAHGIEVLHFSTPAEARGWARDNPAKARAALYLTDYEFIGHKETGLGLVEALDIGERSILITSRFEEKHILAECRRLMVRMIPKGLAGFVPIEVKARLPLPQTGVVAVLLDDDALVHMTWKVAAKSKDVSLATFRDSKEFLAAVERFPKATAIYLDSELGGGVRGEDIARDLHAQGFTNLHLTTGHAPETLPAMPWIKQVLGKEPPWA